MAKEDHRQHRSAKNEGCDAAGFETPNVADAMTRRRTEPFRLNAKPSRIFSMASVARVRPLPESVVSLSNRTQRAISPARPGKRKLAMFPMPSTTRQLPNRGREEAGKMVCQRHARRGRLAKKTAIGTIRKGPFRRPKVFQDCLRSTCRSTRATHPRPIKLPTTAVWSRALRPKSALHLF